jgi:hypothetical protein
MNWSPIPPAVAAVAAVAVAVNRRLVPVLLESNVGVPSPRALAAYAFGGRFVAFALVYGLLLGVAFAVGRRESAGAHGATAVATGVAGAVGYTIATGILLLLVDMEQGLAVSVAGLVAGVGVGVQFAVVAFAGLALAERRGSAA